ncbi:DUF4258 domain-containing protein [Candidatus Methylospira mobilis]|uniref:DUF4258 domain-containing protein n=1 Tax=Candidatus Methylospira mobilis TaxID=1808979 RepID=A0A5Q0BMS0_9GAMM|nr:DUF4258 domain-containing protein [Candidatus Methylospira mobilis]QFY44442.1 DUF4258 domain-containing protein [Candidatus Methylospira mobilis]
MKLVYRQHAIRRMFERNINTDDVTAALTTGNEIEKYPNDTPYPSCLWLGYSGSRPLHIVFADNTEDDERIVITAYEPDSAQWLPDFTKRARV